MASNIGVRVTIDADASSARSQIQNLSKDVDGLSEKMKQTSDAGDWQAAVKFTDEIRGVLSERSKAIEQARKMQDGLSKQPFSFDIDTTQAVRSIEAMDTALSMFNAHLIKAQEAKDWKATETIKKAIDDAKSSRLQLMEQGRIPERPVEPAEAWKREAETRHEELTPPLVREPPVEPERPVEPAEAWKREAETRHEELTPPLVREPMQPHPKYEKIPANHKTAQYEQPKSGDINQRIIIDASQAKNEVNELDRIVADLNERIKEAMDAGDGKTAANLLIGLDHAVSTRKTVMAQANQAKNGLARQNRQGELTPPLLKNALGDSGMWILQQSLNQITHGIISSMDSALSAAKQRAGGDYTGAAVTQRRAHGEIAGQAVGTAAGIGIGALLTPLLGPMAVPLAAGLAGEVGKFLGGIDAKKLEEKLAYSAQYKQALPAIDSLNQNFGGAVQSRTAEQNNAYGIWLYKQAGKRAEGTGLSTRDFANEAAALGAYGIRNEYQAMSMARNQALWSRRTGASISDIQKFEGKAYRYGGKENAADIAYAGLQLQNMGNGQFGEFLNAMERILEEGVEKGFVRGAGEIAGNMQMLYKLSGESPLWQGEQGAKRLSQMNSAISNAANLQSVEDVISYGAARDYLSSLDDSKGGREKRAEILGGVETGTYVDAMRLLEKGVSPELLKGQWSAVRSLEGDNTASIIERFKSMYNVNYEGATRIWSMFRNAQDENGNWKEEFDSESYQKELAGKVKEVRETKDFQSDSATYQNLLNQIDQDIVSLGKIEFNNTELPAIKQEAVKIREILEMRNREEETPQAIQDIKEAPEMKGHIEELEAFYNYRNIPTRYDEMEEKYRQDYGERFSEGMVRLLEDNPELRKDSDFLSYLSQWTTNFKTSTIHAGAGSNELDFDEFKSFTSAIRDWIAAYNREKSTSITVYAGWD
jgi:hypothetical protein